ncbi:MAG TPA: host attachment protein [Sulfuricella sp.]|nr:host attachment protein [Sulfuricella sp.]
MATTWILVANASEAKIYANKGSSKGLEEIAAFDHPDSRKKNSDLVSDRSGHMQSAGNGHGARQPATAPKQHEHETFARRLAQHIEQGRTGNSYQRLIVAAEPRFRGLLNSQLSVQVRNLISGSLGKDYTKATSKELTGHLGKLIYLQ